MKYIVSLNEYQQLKNGQIILIDMIKYFGFLKLVITIQFSHNYAGDLTLAWIGANSTAIFSHWVIMSPLHS